MALNPKRKRFCEEYVIDFNATQAYIRAGYSEKGAAQAAEKLLRNADVQAYIAQLTKKVSEKTEITHQMVADRWWQLANADPGELIRYRHLNCRYCHGIGHQYRWRTPEEYEAKCLEIIELNKGRKKGQKALPMPSDAGGYGFKKLDKPVKDCPHCEGEGNQEAYIEDTQKLSEAGKRLYAGMKLTRDGVEIKMHDQAKALENVARHIGMLKNHTVHENDKENPLTPEPVTGAMMRELIKAIKDEF